MRYSLFIVIIFTVVWSSIATASNSSVFGSVPKGKVYFSKRCAMCHGIDGRGNRGMAPDFSAEWDRLTKSDNLLAANIRAEYKDPTNEIYYSTGECPSHPTISDDDMGDILAFLRRMVERNNHGGRLDEADAFFDKQFKDFDKEENDFDKQFDEFDKEEDAFEKRFEDFDR